MHVLFPTKKEIKNPFNLSLSRCPTYLYLVYKDTLFVGAGIHATELDLGLEKKEINQKALSILLKGHQIQYPTFMLPYLTW